MLNPTSPTLKLETLNNFIRYIQENDFDTVMSVTSVKAEALCNGQLINFDKTDKIPSEMLDAINYIVWAMTAWKRETFLSMQENGKCPVFGGKMSTFTVAKDEATDLDNEEDWIIAEAILRARACDKKNIKYLVI